MCLLNYFGLLVILMQRFYTPYRSVSYRFSATYVGHNVWLTGIHSA